MGLFIPTWKEKDWKKRIEWINANPCIDNSGIYFDIIKHDNDIRVSDYAFKKFIHIIDNNGDMIDRTSSFKTKKDDQNIVLDMILNGRHESISKRAIDYIKNENILITIANNTKSLIIKHKAIQGITNQKYLSDIVNNKKNEENIKSSAFERLTDQNVITEIIVNERITFHNHILYPSILKVTNIVLLRKLSAKIPYFVYVSNEEKIKILKHIYNKLQSEKTESIVQIENIIEKLQEKNIQEKEELILEKKKDAIAQNKVYCEKCDKVFIKSFLVNKSTDYDRSAPYNYLNYYCPSCDSLLISIETRNIDLDDSSI